MIPQYYSILLLCLFPFKYKAWENKGFITAIKSSEGFNIQGSVIFLGLATKDVNCFIRCSVSYRSSSQQRHLSPKNTERESCASYETKKATLTPPQAQQVALAFLSPAHLGNSHLHADFLPRKSGIHHHFKSANTA